MPVYTYSYLYNYMFDNDIKCWLKNNYYHRDNDLPAMDYSNGIKFWYQNNLYHRGNNLPAIEWNDGDKYWFKNGQQYFLFVYSIIIYNI